MSMRFIIPKSFNSTPNSIQFQEKKCEILRTEVFALSYSCNLESRSCRLVSHCIYHYTEFETTWFINLQMYANIEVLFFFVCLLMQSIKEQ